ncbi:MAG: trypsin-like peptidase domain-containing protein [Gemmataceae bacterium]
MDQAPLLPNPPETSYSAFPAPSLATPVTPPVGPPELTGPSSFAFIVTRVFGVVLLAAFIVLLVYLAPYIRAHWRSIEAKTDADALYLARRAELRAEAEVFLERRRQELKEDAVHADKVLTALDKKVDIVSLGFRAVARKVAPLVVNVQNLREPKVAELGPAGKRSLIYDPDKDRKYAPGGVGSGLILGPRLILSNNHVVKGAERLRLTFASGHTIGLDKDAIVADAITDLAVIRLPEDLPAELKEEVDHAAPFADSDRDVQVGDWALAVGSPLGLKQTVTQGVISAKGRLLTLLDLVELIQTDAAMNPGNSGGPLFDQHGRVMGINVAIASDNGVNQGIGFAIPSNTVRKIVDHLVTKGEVPRGYLGIGLEEVAGPRARELFLVDDGGVQVTQIVAGQAAERAGLKVGDVIVRYQKDRLLRAQPVRHLRQLIVDTAPETKVDVEVIREGENVVIPVTIGKRPADLP